MNEIIKAIGEPAILEQLAEECAELAQAALKLSRAMRGENPTPVGSDEARYALVEEMADVQLCIDMMIQDIGCEKEMQMIRKAKYDRCKRRIEERESNDS